MTLMRQNERNPMSKQQQMTASIVLYNAVGKFEVCDTPAQVEMARSKGFVHNKPIAKVLFPSVLYAKDGTTVTVFSKAELDTKLNEGYSEDFIAEPAPKPASPADGGGSTELSRVFLAEISDLRARAEAAESRLDALEAVATQPVPEDLEPRKKKGTQVEAH